MRADYILYFLAVVCFIASASITVFRTTETQLWIVTLAILGFIFLGIGYLRKPTTRKPSEETAIPTTLMVEKPVIVTEEAISELTQVRGIGVKRAGQLQKLGIKTIKDLANASTKDLAGKLEISPKVVRKWITNAKKLTKKS
jgi:replicative superfamily II helicase